MIDNKKYLKDVSSLYSTAQRVKKYVIAELDKIDEKYRKIIAEEKKNLNEQLEVLNSQIQFYASIVGAGEKAEEAPVEEQKEEVEEEIQDTIFPENNEPAEENKEESEDEKTEEEPAPVPADGDDATDSVLSDWPDEQVQEKAKGMIVEEVVEKLEDAGFVNIDTVVKEEENEEESVPTFETNDDGWPIPEDWK